jgi:ketosteroid isomerase-like protein
MADDVTWFIPGNMKTSGLKRGKAEVGKFRHNNLDIFLELQRNVVGLYAEGATVVLEVAASGRLKNGKAYENAGCVVWEIENGKIQRVREYIDTAKAAAINAVSE